MSARTCFTQPMVSGSTDANPTPSTHHLHYVSTLASAARLKLKSRRHLLEHLNRRITKDRSHPQRGWQTNFAMHCGNSRSRLERVAQPPQSGATLNYPSRQD
eukprot:3071929-Amphidinium_carterae.2